MSSGRLYIGDCLEVMRRIPDGSIKGVVTSPPYNLRKSVGSRKKKGSNSTWGSSDLMDRGYDTHSDDMPRDEYIEWQRACLSEMMRVISDDGVIFYNHKWRQQKLLLETPADIVEGFPVRQIIIWQRAGGTCHNDSFFLPTYEVIYMIAKPKFKLPKGVGSFTDVWRIPQVTKKPKDQNHPAPFPLELALRCCKAVGSGIVLDPFMGSGTTAKAARQLGLDWIGIEASANYVGMAMEKLAA